MNAAVIPLVPADPQTRASDPRSSAFVSANAGSGKTSTLVKRVARLLLTGASPAAILCVTFTKAAAAEMQTRLYERLGKWAVADDDSLRADLADFGEPGADLSRARALFARALETPGGLKIQTIHAFCESVLRRFPLEAGLSPGFTVLDDAAAGELAEDARRALAEAAEAGAGQPLGLAYARMSVELAWDSFNALFKDLQARAGELGAYLAAAERNGGYVLDVWRRCGFDAPSSVAEVERQAMQRIRWMAWGRARDALAQGQITDRKLAERMAAVERDGAYAPVREIFCTAAGEARKTLGTKVIAQDIREWMAEEQGRCLEVCEQLCSAKLAEDSVAVLTLALAYLQLYAGAKEDRRALDFDDVIARTRELIERTDAAWVLYKLDGGIEHLLLDEAQDTAPEQWDILRALSAEFFTGSGAGPAGRTVFAVGDEKQSIFSFQGAAPEQLAVQAQALREMVREGGARFEGVPLTTSYRSTPQVLAFVDAVCAVPQVAEGLAPSGVAPLREPHRAFREDAGCVELWPIEPRGEAVETDPWAPVDYEPASSPNRKLAARIASEICAAVARGDEVGAKGGGRRPCRFGDVLILVRRRGPLFHEMIRALKRVGAPVAGADRFTLSEHGVFDDLMALGRVARFAADDLTLAGLLRGPFCEVSEQSLFDLAQPRAGGLISALSERAAERAEWRAALDLVEALQALANEAPARFFDLVLARLDADGRSLRRRLMTRMGIEGEEALLAFLAQAQQAAGQGVHDLESFLALMAGSELQIKREAETTAEDPAGRVRVMTVHGAKGLEAPIVILPDTTSRVRDQGGALMEDGAGGFLWAPRKGEDCRLSKSARSEREGAVDREAARLLYVAITRARDRLVIAGVESRTFERSWRDFIEAAWGGLPETHPFTLLDGAQASRFGPDPQALGQSTGQAAVDAEPPVWTSRPAPAEPGVVAYAGPSRLANATETAAPSPLAREAGLGRYRRGDLIHKLLERLPELAPSERAAAAARMLAKESDLDPAQRSEMAAAALAVLEDGAFAPVFGPGSRAEMALAGQAPGLPAGVAISGRVDRLVVSPERVLVVDYKTNRPAPKRIEDADSAYLLQMAAYVAVLRQVFPGRVVEAALVWTDGPRLMPVPLEAMGKALRGAGGDPDAAFGAGWASQPGPAWPRR